MTQPEALPPGVAPLESVRRLEQRLERRLEAREVAEARVEGARREAAWLVAAARERGAAAAAERRRAVLAAAEHYAERIREEAEAAALRAAALGLRDVAVVALVGLVLPLPADPEES